MDTDTTRSKYSYSRILDEFKSSRKASILIGTQMLSKGLDFPEVSLVGVILADLSLNLGDFRAAETTFQLLVQVAGRAGRGDVNGRVIVQTYTPDHYAILCAKEGSYKKFFDKEITLRKLMGYPPFSHIFIVMISANDEYRVKECLSSLSTIMHKNNVSKSYNILGPAPCMISKLKNKHRWKLIIIGLEEDLLKEYTFKCLKMLKDMYDMKDITINLTLNPSFIS
jgi:primosomal protein N' (replication factor Y)